MKTASLLSGFVLIALTLTLNTACTQTKQAESTADKSPSTPKQTQQTTNKMTDIPLENVPGWSDEHVAHMKKSWITTAEQVVALSATPNGIRSLAEQLQTSEQEAQRLTDSARSSLSPAVRGQMESVVDTTQFGLGARPPKTPDDE